MHGGSPLTLSAHTGSTRRWVLIFGYLRLHFNTIQAYWHQYIEYTNMRVGMLTKHKPEKSKKKQLPWLRSTHEVLNFI